MLTKLIDGGLQPQNAVESLRWYSFPDTDPATINRAGELRVEMGMPDDTIRDLGRMGHAVVQLIVRDRRRCDGQALAL